MKAAAILAFAVALALSGAAFAHGRGHSMGFGSFHPMSSGMGPGKPTADVTNLQTGVGPTKTIFSHESHDSDRYVSHYRGREHFKLKAEWYARRFGTSLEFAEWKIRHRFARWRREHGRLVMTGYGEAPVYVLQSMDPTDDATAADASPFD